MSQNDDQKREQAAAWHIRLRDPASADWDAFMDWLEQDPLHDLLYQEISSAHDEYGELVALAEPPAAANDNPLAARRRLRWIAGIGAVAAASIAGLVGYATLAPATASYAIETKAGQREMIRLADGTRIELNGDSRITLRKGDTRYASLDRGEAAFTVLHDPKDPFTVHVGDDEYQDVGTMFNIARDGDSVETAVASGAVLYNPKRDAVRVDAGRKLLTASSARSVSLSPVDPAEVAAWRQDRLIYKHASMTKIAGDLSRNLGIAVRVAPEIAGRRFSGVIVLGGETDAIFPRLAALLDVDVTHEPHGWRLSARGHHDH